MIFPVIGFLNSTTQTIIENKSVDDTILVVTNMTVTNKYKTNFDVKFYLQIDAQINQRICFTDLQLTAGDKFVDETEYRLSKGAKIMADTNMPKNEITVLINGYEIHN